jgi:hypothetical protein
MSDDQIQAIINDYLSNLSNALGPLPASQQEQLLSEIADHIADARVGLSDESEASIREMLDRIGRPGDIAAEAGVAFASVPYAPVVVNSQRRRRTAYVLVGAVVLLLALIVGLLLDLGGTNTGSPPPSTAASGMPTTLAPAGITMPNLIGQTLPKALAELQALGLNASVTATPSHNRPVGMVVSQGPSAGSTVARGSLVLLSDSSGF